MTEIKPGQVVMIARRRDVNGVTLAANSRGTVARVSPSGKSALVQFQGHAREVRFMMSSLQARVRFVCAEPDDPVLRFRPKPGDIGRILTSSSQLGISTVVFDSDPGRNEMVIDNDCLVPVETVF